MQIDEVEWWAAVGAICGRVVGFELFQIGLLELERTHDHALPLLHKLIFGFEFGLGLEQPIKQAFIVVVGIYLHYSCIIRYCFVFHSLFSIFVCNVVFYWKKSRVSITFSKCFNSKVIYVFQYNYDLKER